MARDSEERTPRRLRRASTMRLVWPALQAATDYAVLAGAVMLAYYVRFHLDAFTRVVPVIYGMAPVEPYLQSALFAAGFWVLFMALRGVYATSLLPSLPRDIGGALLNFFFAFAVLVALLFFYRDYPYSRVVAVLSLLFGGALLVLARALLHTLRRAVSPDRPLHRALVIGPHAEGFEQRIGRAAQGLSVALTLPGDTIPGDLEELVEARELDTVVFAFDFAAIDRARRWMDRLGGRRLQFIFAPAPSELLAGRIATLRIGPQPLIRLRELPFAGWNGVIKRGFDLAAGGLLLLLSLPVQGLVALAVGLTSRGPILYRQTRVGLDGRAFTMLKFRTMRRDAETRTGPVWAEPGDARVTAVGRFLRRFSLDELPQLVNVVRGEMSLVGPRPERPEFVEQFRGEVPRYAERHRVRCGMTGWAQVNGLRGQAPIEERTRYDLFYIENWSLGLDLWILLRTLHAVLFGRDAY